MTTLENLLLFAAVPVAVWALTIAAVDARGKKRWLLAGTATALLLGVTALVVYALSIPHQT